MKLIDLSAFKMTPVNFGFYGFALLTGLLVAGCSYNDVPDPVGEDYEKLIRDFRQEKNRQFKDTATTPFSDQYASLFEELNYYEIKKDHVVWAQFERVEPGEPFIMPTTGSKKPYYIRYGKLRFTLNGKKEELTVYRNLEHTGSEEYEDYLFLPFKDQTNGEETYAGGRYLDLQMPIYNGQLVKLDFNKAYNPFCVYNYDKFDCPIPPESNHLDIGIKAGEKMYQHPDEDQRRGAGSGLLAE